MGYITIGLGTALAVLMGAFYWYFNHSQQQIESLTKDKAKLELAVQEQQATIRDLQKQALRQAQDIKDLQIGLSEANAGKAQLEKLLRKHDLQMLARANPKAVEDRMNAATRRVWRDLEQLTGGKVDTAPASASNSAQTVRKSTFKKLEDVNVQSP